MRSLPDSYRAYLDSIKQGDNHIRQANVNEMVQRLASPEKFASKYAPVVFLSDYTQGKYIYVDEACFSVLGFTAKYFIEGGVDSYLTKWHPADFEIFNNKIFPHNIQFLKELPLEKYQDIVFSYNYRIMNAEGKYLTMMQRFSFIPGNTIGKPLGILGIIIDITHFKADDSVIHTIEEVNNDNYINASTVLFKRIYLPDEKLLTLTKRELEILQLMSQGYSSKQIAIKSGISIFTVNNHRKKMLYKTNTANASELLKNAVKHGLI
jgi:DNA-binding CsgD family transcriptional regulator